MISLSLLTNKPKLMRLLLLLAFFQHFVFQAFADFQLVCPGDITVNCNSDYSNLDLFGKAYVNHNGAIIWVKDCKVVYDINDCGYGTITRTWGVEDPDWKWITCTQIITLSNANAFGDKDITWPKDLIIESCNPEAELKNLPKYYDRPYWKSNRCAKPMLNSTDSRFHVSDGCIKLIRTWRVLDWCVYDPYKNPNAGIFTHVQIIKLITIDTAARISCPKDTIVMATTDCKGAFVKIDPASVSSPCNMPYVIYNTSAYADTNTADASGFYPIGVHTFYFIAEYACGKELKCSVTIDVKRKIPPVPYCKDGVIIDLMPMDTDRDGKPDEGMIDVWAKDLDHGSYHPCTKEKLHFSFSKDIHETSKRLTCHDIGDNEVEIWVTDSLGNQDLCKTKVVIQNNAGIPDCKKPDSLQSKKYTLQLNISNWFDHQPVNNAFVLIQNTTNQSIIQGKANGPGKYYFDQLGKDNNYQIIIVNNNKVKPELSDVKWLDLYLKQQITNATPYQIIAADLNGDARVDFSDLNLLKRLVKGGMSLSQVSDKCVPKEFIFSNSYLSLDEYRNLDMLIHQQYDDQVEKNIMTIPSGIFYSNGLTGNLTSGNSQYSTNDNIQVEYQSSRQVILLRSDASDMADLIHVRLINALGQLVLQKQIEHPANIEYLDLSDTHLETGMYWCIANNVVQIIFIN